MTSDRLPTALVIGSRGHGVSAYAEDLALAGGFPIERAVSVAAAGSAGPCHLHVTDKLLGSSPEEAASAVEEWCAARPTTVTLHDVPQASDGRNLARRLDAYARIARAAVAVATNSRHEQALLLDGIGAVSTPIPLGARTVHPARVDEIAPAGTRTALIAGWFYPGKGHLETVEAMARLGASGGGGGEVIAIGGISPGHVGEAEELVRHGASLGVAVTITGHLSDEEYRAHLRAPGIPVAAHAHMSASRSLLDWVEQGRRPIVVDSPYTREMDELRPGTLRIASDLTETIRHASADPTTTVLPPSTSLTPTLADVASDYRSWWSDVL